MKRILLVGLAVLLGFACADLAFADEAAGGDKKWQPPPKLPRAVAEVVRAIALVIVGVAFGGIVLLVRTILPPIARATDASVGRLTTKRLFLVGLLPMLGAGLLARGLEQLGNKVLLDGYGLLILLPLCLLGVAGLCGALPHLGRSVLRTADREPSPLGAGLAGGLVLGLSAISTAWEPLGVLVGILLVSWCLGIGLGMLIRSRNDAASPA